MALNDSVNSCPQLGLLVSFLSHPPNGFKIDLVCWRLGFLFTSLNLCNSYVWLCLQILDQYKASFDVRAKEGAATYGSLPKSVILVGHSMGGFVARAAIVHPRLRKSAVETVLTLSSPHQ